MCIRLATGYSLLVLFSIMPKFHESMNKWKKTGSLETYFKLNKKTEIFLLSSTTNEDNQGPILRN